MKAAKRVKYGERERATLVKMLDDAKVAEPLVRLRKTFKTSEPKDEGGHYLKCILHIVQKLNNLVRLKTQQLALRNFLCKNFFILQLSVKNVPTRVRVRT